MIFAKDQQNMSTVKPSIPKGTRDFSPVVISKRNYLKAQLATVFESFGFQPIETPSFERSERKTMKTKTTKTSLGSNKSFWPLTNKDNWCF